MIWVGYYLVSPSATPSSATGKEKAPRAPKVVAPKKELTEADLDLDWIPVSLLFKSHLKNHLGAHQRY